MSAVRLAYYWADYAIGYWARIWPVRVRGGLVVSERWWWDMYVDPRRHRIRPMPRAARFLGRFVPRADAFFVLDAPSSRIHERKRELATSEIERQRTAWAQLAPTIPNLRTIDAAAPLPDMTGEVIQAVVERQRRRISPDGRLGHRPPTAGRLPARGAAVAGRPGRPRLDERCTAPLYPVPAASGGGGAGRRRARKAGRAGRRRSSAGWAVTHRPRPNARLSGCAMPRRAASPGSGCA